MKKLLLASALLIAAAGCSTTASNSTPSPTAAATAQPAATPLDSAKQMATESQTLSDLLKAKKDADIKKQAEKLDAIWVSFEDGIKPKYPELYVKVEKYLTPLTAGAGLAKLDYDALDRFNKELGGALAELTTALESGKSAVNESGLHASAALQEATKKYNEYVRSQGKELTAKLEALAKAIHAGDLKLAQQAYGEARMPYERIEPVIERFAELDGLMDARVDDYKNEEDPEFTGYHRLEHFLFVKKTTKGAEPFADKLLENGKEMQKSIEGTDITLTDFVTGVGELMEEAQTKKITGEEERWSGATVPVIRANVEGAEQIYALVRDELAKKDAALNDAISKSLQQVFQTLDALSPQGPTWTPYDTIEQSKQVDLKNRLEALAEPLVKMPGKLGE